jgi:hypothetical protein
VVLLLPLVLPLVLSGCGTEVAGAGGGGSVDSAELRKRAGESALEHVYVTEIPGFTLAAQSAGVIGNDGFSGTYVSKESGGQIQLSVDRGKLPPEGCGGCVKDGANWYSAVGGGGTYSRAEGGHVVRLIGTGVDRATLRKAAEKAHHASPAEMDAVLPEAGAAKGAGGVTGGGGPTGGGDSTGGGQVERGDLPPVGDGAPRNDVGASG